jgi:nitrogen fixation protein FixH
MRFFRIDDQHPLTGWHMLAIVSLFFGTIIAVNLVMAFAATGSFPGLVVENSYVASQRYNELLARARSQDAAGWRHDLSLREGRLVFSLIRATGEPAAGFAVTAYAGRPSTTREDRVLAFADIGGGHYESLEPLPPGRWDVETEARQGRELIFRNTQTIFVRNEGEES